MNGSSSRWSAARSAPRAGERVDVGREDEDAHVVADELADLGSGHRRPGEGLLVVAHDQPGGVRIGQTTLAAAAEHREQVGLVLGAADPRGREGPMPAQGIDADAAGAAGHVDALEGARLAVDGGSVVALHHLGAGRDRLRQPAEEDVLVEGRQTLGDGHVRREQARSMSRSLTSAPASRPSSSGRAVVSPGGGAPQRGAQVPEHRRAGLGQEHVLREDLVEVDLEGGAHVSVDRHLPECGHGLEEGVVATVAAVDADHAAEAFGRIGPLVSPAPGPGPRRRAGGCRPRSRRRRRGARSRPSRAQLRLDVGACDRAPGRRG